MQGYYEYDNLRHSQQEPEALHFCSQDQPSKQGLEVQPRLCTLMEFSRFLLIPFLCSSRAKALPWYVWREFPLQR